jgi:hypothetical protein
MDDKTLFICKGILISLLLQISRDENKKNNFKTQNSNVNTFEAVSWFCNNFENCKQQINTTEKYEALIKKESHISIDNDERKTRFLTRVKY